MWPTVVQHWSHWVVWKSATVEPFPTFRIKRYKIWNGINLTFFFPASSPLTRDSEIFQLQACGRIVSVHRSCAVAKTVPLCPTVYFWCPLNNYAGIWIWCHEDGTEMFDEWHDCWDAGEVIAEPSSTTDQMQVLTTCLVVSVSLYK